VNFKLFVDYDRAPKLERGGTGMSMSKSARLPGAFLDSGKLLQLGTLIRRIIRDEDKNADSICVVLSSDDYLSDINRKFLNHNYRTDVISFDLSESDLIDGEIYVSIDRAKVQARRYRVPLEREILRLIIHGTLHLAGLNDKTRSEKLRMRKRENIFIQHFYRAPGGKSSISRRG